MISGTAAAETDPPTLEGPGLGTAPDDLAQIRAVMTDFIALFAEGLPQPSAILPFLSEDFRNEDVGRTDFANDIANFSDLVGGRIADIQILIDYDFNGGDTPLATTTFTLYNEDGVSLGLTQGFTMIRGEDGVWRLHGDQSILEIESTVLMITDVATGCRSSSLSFEVFDPDTSNSAQLLHA